MSAPGLDVAAAASSAAIEQNKATARRWSEELWGRGHLAVADEIIAPDMSVTMPAIPFPHAARRMSGASS